MLTTTNVFLQKFQIKYIMDFNANVLPQMVGCFNKHESFSLSRFFCIWYRMTIYYIVILFYCSTELLMGCETLEVVSAMNVFNWAMTFSL